jgi:hypothetical protein
MGEGFLGMIIEQKNEGCANLLSGLGGAVRFEAMPITGGDRESFR